MEKKLASMFEYQRFAQNSRLSRLIAETESRYAAQELNDDDLWMVNAAGVPDAFIEDQRKKENKSK